MRLSIKNNASHLLHPKLFRYLKMINWAITPLRHKRSLLVLELLMNIKLIYSGEEAMTVLNSVHLPPISTKARISQCSKAGRDFYNSTKKHKKERSNLMCSFEKIFNEATWHGVGMRRSLGKQNILEAQANHIANMQWNTVSECARWPHK